jgi:N-acetylneuraminic acid mutarotase
MKGRSSKPLLKPRAAVRGLYLMTAVLALVACGGKSSSNSASDTIGGTISGLTAGSVVLLNGTATVTIAAGASTWAFPSSFAAGSSYSVTVLSQPAEEVCDVTSGGNGAALSGNVSYVTVVCSDYGQWVWQGGFSTVNASGVYGTQGAASASNVPGARFSASSWTDSSGNFWLFGGSGYDSTGGAGYLNDLWQYSPSTGLWTWVSGGNGDNASGLYGTQGTASASNEPGARYAASSWIDSSGNLWLFGGIGCDSSGTVGKLNDLWEYSPSSNEWTWVSGGNVADAAGVYGTLGAAAAGNVPGARYAASSWIDATGNLWLLGGYGYDSTGGVGALSDLWQYSPITKVWTWISGGNAHNSAGVYGTLGTAAAGNVPGARQAANSWIDSSGNLLLFGGYGYGSTGDLGYLNDLWQYSPSTGLWTWLSGGNGNNASGIYGTLATAAAGNVLGARQAASSWIDSSGDLWVFGGVGYDSTGDAGNLNDLWQYSPSTKEWTWISGGNAANATGAYGIQGTASGGSVLGGRYSASSWIDSTGNLWLFGGAGYGATGNGYLNDLWQFVRP